MLFREISRTLGIYLYFLAAALGIPFLIALYYRFFGDPIGHPQPHSALAFFITILICLALAFLLHRVFGKKASGSLYKKESLAIAVIIWFLTAGIGGLPFVLSGTLKNPVDAYFEAMSGLTTTGATILCAKEYDPKTGEEIAIKKVAAHAPEIEYVFNGTVAPVRNPQTGQIVATGIEAVGNALLFWRSFMSWLGGMGIVVLFVAFLPAMGVGGKALFQTEMSAPSTDGLAPRIRETASLLWKTYLGLSVLQFILLLLTNREISVLLHAE